VLAVWAVAYTLVGYAIGAYWSDLLAMANPFGIGIVALVILAFTGYAIQRHRRRSREKD
jgi:membrane protein DedA with SNARE-associated domain